MGTNYIAPTWRQPENTNKDKLSNYSIALSGSNEYITVDNNIFSGLETWSMAGFYNLSALNADSAVFGKYGNSPQQILLYWDNPLGWRLLWEGDTTGGALVELPSISVNEWHFIAVTYDGATVKMYLDDQVYSNTVTTGAIITDTDAWQIAADGNSNKDFRGKLSQLSFYDYAVEATEIAYLRNGNNPMAINGANPIAYYPLGDNSNPTATAGYPNISVGAGSVFDFDGTDIILADPTFATGPINSIDGAISISSWFKTTASGDTLVGRTKTTSAAFNFPWLLYTDNSNVGKLAWALNNTNGDVLEIRLTGTTDPQGDPLILINDGSFHNVVATYDGSNTSALYIDGVLQKTVTVADFGNYPIPTAYPAGRTCIGGTQNSSGAWPNGAQPSFVGEVSNVQIWNTKIESSEVTTLYNNGVPLFSGTQPQAANLRGWWKLDQSANWEADTVGEWQIPDNRSAYPQSFSFDSNKIDLGLESNFSLGGASKYSTSLWFKKDSNSTNCLWGYNYGDSSGSGFYLWQTSGNFRVAVGNDSLTNSFGYYNIASANIPIGEWTNIVVVFDGTLASGDDRIKVYQNGEVAIGTYTNGSNFPATLPTGNGASNRNVYLGQLQLGNGSFSYNYDGEMSNVQQWDTDLSLPNAKTIYNNGIPLPTASVEPSSLKAWAKLDNSSKWNTITSQWNIPLNPITPTPWSKSAITKSNSQTFVNNTSASGIDLTSPTTCSFWIRTATTQANFAINAGSFGGGNDLAVIGSRILVYRGASNYRYFNFDSSIINDDNWHNIVLYSPGYATADIASTRMFMDGLELSINTTLQNSLPGTPNNNPILGVGNIYSDMISASFSNAVIWASDQTSNINEIYNNGTPSSSYTNTPILWWKLNNLTSGLDDLSGNNNNGITSGPVFTVTQEDIIAYQLGISSAMTNQSLVNNNVSTLNGESSGMDTTNLVQSNLTRKQPFSSYSMFFDGIEDIVQITRNANLEPENITVSCWVNVTASGSHAFGYFVSKIHTTGSSVSYGIYKPATPTFIINIGGVLKFSPVYGTDIQGQGWHHLVGTYDGANVRLYVNGTEVGSGTGTSGNIDYTTEDAYIGSFEPSSLEIDGNISNTAIWDSALNTDDILNLYNNGVPQDLNNFRITPVAWYPMDQSYTYFNGSVLVARDVINGNDGTGANVIQENIVGNAPGSNANGVGSNLTIANLKGDMKDSINNSYSINMADYAGGVTNPADSGRSTNVP